MTRIAAVALFAALSLAACSKAPPTPAAPAAQSNPMAPEAPPAAAAAEVKPGAALSVAAVDLGTDVGADNRVSTALESFTAADTIVASITLNNAGAGSAEGNVGARWTGADGQVFNDESQAKSWPAGVQALAFRIADPKGFKPGNYRLDVSLNGSVVQSKDFSVK